MKNNLKSAGAFFFLFFLHGFSIGTRQQGISYNGLRLGDGYEALALCGWSSLRQTAVISWGGLLPQNLNWNANTFSFLFCAVANINLKN